MSLTTMDDVEAQDGPRRGGRVRKQVERLDPTVVKKGKARQDDDDESEDGQSDYDIEMEDEEGTPVPRAPKNGKKRVSVGGSKRAAPKQKKRKSNAGSVEVTGETIEGIKTDCPLFNALLSPDIAIQQVVEDWVDNFQQSADDEVSEKTCFHELILFCIRCCGLNADVDEDEVMDTDGIVDTLERIQDESIKVSAATYPLISRSKGLKPFRNNLNLFLPHLIKTLSLTPLLYHTRETTNHSFPVLSLLLSWLHSMSTSALRPIRHTSTYITLKINSALCEVAAGVSNDLSLRQRQKEAEVKKGGKGPAAQKKVKELEAKVAEASMKKMKLEGDMKENFDVLFVHRVRDADPAIRTDCFKELGVWVKKYGEMYVATSYLSYFTRGCNDPNTHARLESVKALPSLFINDHHVSRARTVILRVAPRLVEIALRDIDVSVRVHAIQVITQIDKTGIFEDEDDEDQRDRIARLIFDHEPRVRKAVGLFIHGLWTQKLEALKTEWSSASKNKKKRAGTISEEAMEERLRWKALASLLVEISDSLDKTDEAETSRNASNSQSMNRANAAVEAMSVEFQDWENLVEYLLLDHSSDDLWLLEEEEESLMLKVLVACVKQDNEEDEEDERTKTLMNVLPRLFTKHQADPDSMAGILSITERMDLSLYLDMRKTSAYESLWDDVTKQFLQHTNPLVLSAAIRAIVHLSANASMTGTNEIKSAELEENLFTSLRDGINGEDVFSMSMDEDRLTSLQAVLLRLSLLQRSRDIVEAFESEEGGQSSGWYIILAFAERGEVGYKEEAKLVEYAIQIIFFHLTWLYKRFTEADALDETKTKALKEKLDRAIDVFEKLAIQGSSNAVEVVRRQGFISYLNIHMLFSAKGDNLQPAAKACSLRLADEIQHRLGGAFEAAADRYYQEMAEDDEDADDDVERSQQEFVFLQLVSVFIGAIRCGVVEVDHAKDPLAHYGRFGATYDAIVRKLVDVLRDEGIYNKQADTVQHVAASALETSFTAFLDSDIDEPVAPVSLAKLIASAFVVQGTHFTILRQIRPDEVYEMHKSLLDYISRKLSMFVKQAQATKSKSTQSHAETRLTRALSFFRVLLHLLGPVTGKDAWKLKGHLDNMFKEVGVKPSQGRSWEGYKAYEKKLVSIAGRDPNVKVVTHTQAEHEREDTEVMTEVPDEEDNVVDDGDDVNAVGVAMDDDQEEEEDAPMQSTPAKRPRGALENEEIGEESRIGEAEPFGDVDLNLDFGDEDLDIDLDFTASQEKSRARSVSIEPTAKRRKTVRRI